MKAWWYRHFGVCPKERRTGERCAEHAMHVGFRGIVHCERPPGPRPRPVQPIGIHNVVIEPDTANQEVIINVKVFYAGEKRP